MSNPKEQMTTLTLIAEYDATELCKAAPTALSFMESHSGYLHRDAKEFIFHVGGPTEFFLIGLGIQSKLGCPQELISYLKHARDVGAAWALFSF
jgi:hypothetical protein